MTAVTADAATRTTSRSVLAGRVLSGIAILALAADAAGKLFVPEVMIASSPALGLPTDPAFHRLLGAILAAGVALHLWRRTSVLGAILLTGFLGGAIATHARIGSPLFSHTLFGVYLGVILWVGLWLRDGRARSLFL